MALDWTNIVTLVGGWALAQVGSYIDSKRSMASARAIARDTRRYELGREGYKAAMAAINLGLDIAGEQLQPTPDEMHEILLKFFDPIRDARIAFAIPMTHREIAELIEAVFTVPTAVEKGGDIEAAKTKAFAILNKHRREITDAWKEVLHGK